MHTRLGLFTLILCIATGSQAYRMQWVSVSQGPYDVPPSGAMNNAPSGLETEPQAGVTGIQPLIPNQNRGNTAEQTNNKIEIEPNPILPSPAQPGE
ncbi:MAG TPA: hypothetical protein DDY37_06005 [Legionella sp.]|nr:hypothetical protein [Legionella sp.]